MPVPSSPSGSRTIFGVEIEDPVWTEVYLAIISAYRRRVGIGGVIEVCCIESRGYDRSIRMADFLFPVGLLVGNARRLE